MNHLHKLDTLQDQTYILKSIEKFKFKYSGLARRRPRRAESSSHKKSKRINKLSVLFVSQYNQYQFGLKRTFSIFVFDRRFENGGTIFEKGKS
jgi:hypothetical protein